MGPVHGIFFLSPFGHPEFCGGDKIFGKYRTSSDTEVKQDTC